MNIGLNNLWSVPFYYSEFHDSKKINADLINIITKLDNDLYNKKQYQIAGINKGLTSRWYSYNFLDLDEHSISILKDFIKSQVNEYLEILGHKNPSLMYQSWANRLENGSFLKRHSHSGPYSYVSGVYFVKTKKTSTVYHLPLDTRIPGVEDFFETKIEIKNTEGGLVIFPSFIEHNSTPTIKNEERITIAFDILFTPPKDKFHNNFDKKVISVF
jgi:hypothetical protein